MNSLRQRKSGKSDTKCDTVDNQDGKALPDIIYSTRQNTFDVISCMAERTDGYSHESTRIVAMGNFKMICQKKGHGFSGILIHLLIMFPFMSMTNI